MLPFEWWLPRHYYAKINDAIMSIIYSPLLLIVASLETREARRIRWNRRRGEEDDDDVQEWEHVAEEVDFDIDDTWRQTVRESTANVNTDTCTVEIFKLQDQVRELTETVRLLTNERNGEAPRVNGESSSSGSEHD